MKAFLLYKDRDFILSPKFVVPSESDRWRSRSDVPREVPPPHEQALIRDLELHTLCEAMAHGDNFLFEVAKNALMSPLTNPDEIVYRQAILRDCLANAPVIHAMYGIAMEALEAERKNYRSTLDWPGIILHRSVEILQLFVGLLKRLRQVADDHAGIQIRRVHDLARHVEEGTP